MNWTPINRTTGVRMEVVDDETKIKYERQFKGKFRFEPVKGSTAPEPKESKKKENPLEPVTIDPTETK